MVDIFIRTYEKDLPWLVYCLQSIHKYVTGYRNIIVCIPDGQVHLLKDFNIPIVVTCPNYKNDYLGQQVSKLRAYERTNADYFLFVDSDCVFTKPCDVNVYLHKDKPVILKTPYSTIPEVKFWQDITEKAIGFKPAFEFMRRIPLMYHRSTLEKTDSHMVNFHGCSLEHYVISQPNREFSEFNLLGAFAHKNEYDKYYWIDTTKDELPELYCRQFWSWGGFTEDVKKEISKYL